MPIFQGIAVAWHEKGTENAFSYRDTFIEEMRGKQMGRKLCLFLCCACIIGFSGMAYGKDLNGVCKSPYIELARYKWEGNRWNFVRDFDSKTFEIDDIRFEVSLDDEGVTVKTNGKEVIYADYREYYSDWKDRSNSRGKPYALHKVRGKNVMVRILNIAPDLPDEGGVRWCILQVYVEASKASCGAVGGKLIGEFPVKPRSGNISRKSHESGHSGE
jgi:hypothetical protein